MSVSVHFHESNSRAYLYWGRHSVNVNYQLIQSFHIKKYLVQLAQFAVKEITCYEKLINFVYLDQQLNSCLLLHIITSEASTVLIAKKY